MEIQPLSRPTMVYTFFCKETTRPTTLKEFQAEWKFLNEEEKDWLAQQCSAELGIPLKTDK